MGGTRQKIIEAARRAFYTSGYQHTSLADIAGAAGVPKGNFYYHFRSKDDVLLAVNEARGEGLVAMLARFTAEFESPRQRVERVVAMMSHDRDELVQFGCPIGSLLTELGKDREDLRRACVTATMEVLARYVADQLAAVGHPAAEARSLAIRLLGRCQGAVLMGQAYADVDLLATETADILRWAAELTELQS